MKIFFKSSLLFTFTLLLLTSCAPSKPKELTVLHFNDVYQIEALENGKVGGAARVKTQINQLATEQPLVIFSGDAFGGGMLSSYFKGKQMIEAFNKVGLNLATCGNHEFDFGVDEAIKRFKESQFKWVCSNLVYKANHEYLDGTSQKELLNWNGVKVGIIGLAGPWLEHTKANDDLMVQDFVEVGKARASQLKKSGAEIIIAITHMDLADDQKLALEVPDIDLILGGHEHHHINETLNETLLWKTDSDWRHLGHIKAQINPKNKIALNATLLPLNETVAEDEEIKKWVQSVVGEFEVFLAEDTGGIGTDLDILRSSVRTKESNAGNLVADAFKFNLETQIAIINGGSLRTNGILPKGRVTLKDLKTMMPFNNKIFKVELTGEQIKKVLEACLTKLGGDNGSFPQIAGFKFSFDESKIVGERVVSLSFQNAPIEPTQKLTVATSDYFLNEVWKKIPTIGEIKVLLHEDVAQSDLTLLRNYFDAAGLLSPQIEGRIQNLTPVLAP